MNDPLPPEVLKLLGDDATPEEAASGFVEQSESSSDIATHNGDCATRTGEFEWRHRAKVEAWSAWAFALAAAAIRECEARRKHSDLSIVCSTRVLCSTPAEMQAAALARDFAAKEELEAIRDFDALRNWRKP